MWLLHDPNFFSVLKVRMSFSFFRKRSAPPLNFPKQIIENNQNLALNATVRAYVNAYNKTNANKRRTNFPMNRTLLNSLKNYINKKRGTVAGKVAAVAKIAGGTNNQANAAAKAALIAAKPNSTPGIVGSKTGNAAARLGAPPTVVAAVAAAGAGAHAKGQGANPSRVNAERANASANAAGNAVNPNTRPATVARIAANAVEAAGGNNNAQRLAAARAAENQARNQGASPSEANAIAILTRMNKNNTWKNSFTNANSQKLKNAANRTTNQAMKNKLTSAYMRINAHLANKRRTRANLLSAEAAPRFFNAPNTHPITGNI